MLKKLLPLVFLASLVLSMQGCSSFFRGLPTIFGDEVEVNLEDSTPPEVRFILSETQFFSPTSSTGRSIIIDEFDTTVRARGNVVSIFADARDRDGISSIRLSGTVTPICNKPSSGLPGARPGPASFFPVRLIESQFVRNEIIDGNAPDKVFVLYGFEIGTTRSEYCPDEDRHRLSGAILELRATAFNFSSDPTVRGARTGDLTVRMGIMPDDDGKDGGDEGDGSACPGEGDSCQVTPGECSGRRNFSVPGRIACRNGVPQCRAIIGTDYCVTHGGVCGNRPGQICTSESECNPFSVCGNADGDGIRRCKSIILPERSTGEAICTPINGACWLPNELGNPSIRDTLCN